jgi:hypothetical protein
LKFEKPATKNPKLIPPKNASMADTILKYPVGVKSQIETNLKSVLTAFPPTADWKKPHCRIEEFTAENLAT